MVFLFLLVTGAHAASAPVLATGHQSPLGLPFSTFADPALMADGRVAFLGSSSGAFRRDGSNLVHVSAAGDVLADGRVVAGVSPPALGPGGCTAVRAFLVDGGSRILERCGATTSVVAATGESAPGGGSFAEFTDNVATGGAGQVAFTATLDDGNSGLFVWAGGGLTEAVRTGEAAPNGGFFSALHLIGVATDGRVGFRGTVAAGRDGIFMATVNGFRSLVQTGDASPVGSTFRTVTGASMNDRGTVAFRGDLNEDNKAGVFRIDTSGPVPLVQPVVLEGDSVGGPTITINSLPSSLTPAINGGGTVAFRATVAGGDGGSGIFVAAPGATLQQIVTARDKTAVGALVRLRDPAIADDGSLVIPASVTGSGPLLVVYRAGTLSTLAQVGQVTDIDTGDERFRFAQPSVRGAAEEAVFTGTREGIFVAGRDGSARDARVRRRQGADEPRRNLRRVRSAGRGRARGRGVRRRGEGRQEGQPRHRRQWPARAPGGGGELGAGPGRPAGRLLRQHHRFPEPTRRRAARRDGLRGDAPGRQDPARAPAAAQRQAPTGRDGTQGRAGGRQVRHLRHARAAAWREHGVRDAGG